MKFRNLSIDNSEPRCQRDTSRRNDMKTQAQKNFENNVANNLIDAYLEEREALKALDADLKAKAEKEAHLAQFQKADRRKTSSLIKKHIKANFPVKSVRVSSDVYSMGSSINVTYVADEKIEGIENFVNSLQYGHFDGMQDMYIHDHGDEVILDGFILNSAKYTFCKFEKYQAPEPAAQEPARALDVIEAPEVVKPAQRPRIRLAPKPVKKSFFKKLIALFK